MNFSNILLRHSLPSLHKYVLTTFFIGSTYYICKDKDTFECKDCNKCTKHNDLRPYEGKCVKELNDFGNCLEKNNDNIDKCSAYLEAYKRCLQRI